MIYRLAIDEHAQSVDRPLSSGASRSIDDLSTVNTNLSMADPRPRSALSGQAILNAMWRECATPVLGHSCAKEPR